MDNQHPNQLAEAIVSMVDDARAQLGYIEVCGASPDLLRSLNTQLVAIRRLLDPT